MIKESLTVQEWIPEVCSQKWGRGNDDGSKTSLEHKRIAEAYGEENFHS